MEGLGSLLAVDQRPSSFISCHGILSIGQLTTRELALASQQGKEGASKTNVRVLGYSNAFPMLYS